VAEDQQFTPLQSLLLPGICLVTSEKNKPVRVSPEEGLEDDQKAGAPLLQRQAEGAWRRLWVDL